MKNAFLFHHIIFHQIILTCDFFQVCFNILVPEIYGQLRVRITAQKMKFSIKDFFSIYDQIRRKRGFGHIY